MSLMWIRPLDLIFRILLSQLVFHLEFFIVTLIKGSYSVLDILFQLRIEIVYYVSGYWVINRLMGYIFD